MRELRLWLVRERRHWCHSVHAVHARQVVDQPGVGLHGLRTGPLWPRDGFNHDLGLLFVRHRSVQPERGRDFEHRVHVVPHYVFRSCNGLVSMRRVPRG